mmetsp:Transcript_18740/g.31918  ORF Transcript_18740/g.31918 Transcript_18740/m.31918 type:complete len:99 (+) Transcript_18740:3026-3322(+)
MFAPVADHLPHFFYSLREISHRRAVRESHEIDTLALFKMTNFPWINIEEYSWDTNDIVFDTLLKEAEAVVDRSRQRRKISPDVKSCRRLPLNSDADFG